MWFVSVPYWFFLVVTLALLFTTALGGVMAYRARSGESSALQRLESKKQLCDQLQDELAVLGTVAEERREALADLMFASAPLAREKTTYSFTGQPPTRQEEVERNEHVEVLRQIIQKHTGATLRPEDLSQEAKGFPDAVVRSWEAREDDQINEEMRRRKEDRDDG